MKTIIPLGYWKHPAFSLVMHLRCVKLSQLQRHYRRPRAWSCNSSKHPATAICQWWGRTNIGGARFCWIRP